MFLVCYGTRPMPLHLCSVPHLSAGTNTAPAQAPASETCSRSGNTSGARSFGTLASSATHRRRYERPVAEVATLRGARKVRNSCEFRYAVKNVCLCAVHVRCPFIFVQFLTFPPARMRPRLRHWRRRPVAEVATLRAQGVSELLRVPLPAPGNRTDTCYAGRVLRRFRAIVSL